MGGHLPNGKSKGFSKLHGLILIVPNLMNLLKN